MDNRKSLINNHYENYDEDNRLIKDNTHNVEYRVTTTFIEKYLKKKR